MTNLNFTTTSAKHVIFTTREYAFLPFIHGEALVKNDLVRTPLIVMDLSYLALCTIRVLSNNQLEIAMKRLTVSSNTKSSTRYSAENIFHSNQKEQ